TNRKDQCFVVLLQEIKDNDYDLSIQKYTDIEYEEVEYESPKKLKEQILELEKEIVKDVEGLEV
ncbi:MAG: SAM-dependent methyltransferase, partial [Nanoarchaeota archaeon]|nr:SAM-dependent methyltransferase [Nanoarchaeota archaeon]